ncbi:hypothetical protein S1OALGB6SA_1956 [Olavius algarvensis spirochete endosymbiont]|nr:MAG: hypothetical protein [Olavius algarvensis spirochete endosymbiont]VDB00866.1 hypothetical protein S1OALGB6SA_1956 [Olavius algarvensis spirochete endosymbiont]
MICGKGLRPASHVRDPKSCQNGKTRYIAAGHVKDAAISRLSIW